ncbi:MAG TPA: rhomboid family intramembrane serine protease, partial [Rhodothermales bacterium]|nr:rhomboid family intramembrane serine protease [Rhodothermales bacterium]
AGLGHLLFNMLTLYFFGPVMEQLLGSIPFYILYFGSELTAHLFSLYMNRNNPNYAAIGASGAVSGVVFAFCLVSPFTPLFLFFIPIPIPAIVFALLYVLGSIYAMRVSRGGGAGSGFVSGIAHEAHIGGAIGGVVLAILLEPALLPHFLNQIGL